MSTAEYHRKLDELDRLLNDLDVPVRPERIWSLLADVSKLEIGIPGHAVEAAIEAAPLANTPL